MGNVLGAYNLYALNIKPVDCMQLSIMFRVPLTLSATNENRIISQNVYFIIAVLASLMTVVSVVSPATWTTSASTCSDLLLKTPLETSWTGPADTNLVSMFVAHKEFVYMWSSRVCTRPTNTPVCMLSTENELVSVCEKQSSSVYMWQAENSCDKQGIRVRLWQRGN